MKLFNMKNTKSQYKILMEQAHEILIFFDSHGRISDCNKQAIKELGYGEELYNLPIYYIFQKAFVYQDRQLKLDEKYKDRMAEAIAYRKNQTCFPVELKVSFFNVGMKHTGICSAINISEKKEMDREIKDLKDEIGIYNQQSTQLMANVTHELRTPINGIAGFSNNLLNTELNSEQLEAVNIIKRCCENMNMIINDLLDYAKISNKKLRLELREFNFRNAIQQIIDVNKIRINEKGLKLLVDISDEIPEVLIGDELRLTQILNNLFSNAIKFTSVGHIGLEISTITELEEYIELFFMLFDTGIGIGIEDMDKLFKNFTQVDSSITRRFGGTGLGLSISKKLIETMGGRINVDSELNKGSVFSFSIRLKLPDKKSNTQDIKSEDALLDDLIINQETGNENKDVLSVSEVDYISKRLHDANYSSLKISYTRERMMGVMKEFLVKMEKLTICIEMGNWEKAEEIAFAMKALIPKEHIEESKIALRLLLAVRKENRDTSLEIIKMFQERIHKEVN